MFLLDTNVISEVRKTSPHPEVARWFAAVGPTELFLSVLVVGEIRQGIERLRSTDPDQSAVFERWLGQLRDTFADRLVGISAEVAEIWGRLNAARPIAVVDGLLAATALVYNWTLVTRNVGDVDGTGARVLNPFATISGQGD